MRASLTSLALVCFVATTAGQSAPSGLVMVTAGHEYPGLAYDKPSEKPGFTYFQGEPITFRVGVVNRGAATTVVRPMSSSAPELFTYQAFVDDEPVGIKVTFADLGSKSWGGSVPDMVNLADGIELRSGESIEWIAQVVGGLRPGYYRVDTQIQAIDDAKRRVRGPSWFMFEVRPRTSSTVVEIARRDAYRLLERGDIEGTKAALGRLAKVHPNSYHHPYLLHRVALLEGQNDDARRFLALAARIVRERSDNMFLKNARKEEVDDVVRGFASREMSN